MALGNLELGTAISPSARGGEGSVTVNSELLACGMTMLCAQRLSKPGCDVFLGPFLDSVQEQQLTSGNPSSVLVPSLVLLQET